MEKISDPLESWLDENEEVITTSTHHRKILTDLSMQQQRHRLSIVLESIKELSITENTSEITIAALALQLLSNQTANRDIAKLCKSIVHDHYPGKFGNILKKELDVDKAVFLINFLEIGKRKYTQLRQHLLSSEINFPAYHKLVEQRNIIILRPIIQMYPNPTNPVGVHVRTICPPYILQNTVNYTATINSRFSKSFILFCFKPVQITSCSGVKLWKNNSPNSPFSQRPIFLLAGKENEENIRNFMTDLINPDTDQMHKEGFSLDDHQKVHVEIVRSMFDGKMAALLSGAGGASCQLCTTTRAQIKDRDFVLQGYPINRLVSEAIQLFGDIEDSESFFYFLQMSDITSLTNQCLQSISYQPLLYTRTPASSDGLTY